MQTSRGASKLIWYEAMGFGTIIAISWLDELIGLPQLLFGGASVPNWKESVLESGITLLVAIPTLLLSSRLTRRLYRLEGVLRLRSEEHTSELQSLKHLVCPLLL